MLRQDSVVSFQIHFDTGATERPHMLSSLSVPSNALTRGNVSLRILGQGDMNLTSLGAARFFLVIFFFWGRGGYYGGYTPTSIGVFITTACLILCNAFCVCGF